MSRVRAREVDGGTLAKLHLPASFGAMARASQGGVALVPSLTYPKPLEPPGNLGHGVGAGLCRMWCMWWAEALALSLLMFSRCRICLWCDPVGAVAAAALAAGAV